MNIQVISDIHLEFGSFDLPYEDCDMLIAAGDIGVGTEGLEWLQTLNVPVIYVAGNHEYWGHEINELRKMLASNSKGSNVHYLEKNSVTVGGVRFIGCTLWTNFNECDDEEKMQELESIMNDFRYIYSGDASITPKQLIIINQDSKQWLDKEINKPHDGPTVVVTHHAPSLKSWATDKDDYLKYAYCNELETMFKDKQIDLWVHGHIHHSSDYSKHGVRVICNPRGYKGYQLVERFDPKKTIKI